jgi:hypothetical protein
MSSEQKIFRALNQAWKTGKEFLFSRPVMSVIAALGSK